MKIFSMIFVMVALVSGCRAMSQADFVYFNLSSNEIKVENILGLPPDTIPGVLVPVHDESGLNEKSFTLFDNVRISDSLVIVWQESGALHQFKLMRDELGIHAKLEKGKIRFTYLGNDK